MDLINFNWYQEYSLFIEYLKSISDTKYKEFSTKLTPTKYEMLGIRIPMLRNIAKTISKKDYKAFLSIAGNTYFEEVMLKCLVISHIKDLNELMEYFYSCVDLIDNWAINDTFCNSLKIVNNNKTYFLSVIDKLIKSNKEYHLRVGLIILLNYYVLEEYLDIIFSYLDLINNDLYYVDMAMAWLLCEVFVKYPDITLKYFENNKLNKFTINKSISKIRDSYRVSKEIKDYILKFKK